MSANRSVQAAQRRRAGPESGIPMRGPQPSINSSQVFSNQSRPISNSGPNTPSSRNQIGTQKKMTQSQSPTNDKLSSVTRMTIPQAITLITLRLGILESKISNLPNLNYGNVNEESGLYNSDPGFLQAILERLEFLENNPSSTPESPTELNLFKQQIDTIKQATLKSNGNIISLAKENAGMKLEIENLKRELLDTKDIISSSFQNIIDSDESLLPLSSELDVPSDNLYGYKLHDDNLNNSTLIPSDEVVSQDCNNVNDSRDNTDTE